MRVSFKEELDPDLVLTLECLELEQDPMSESTGFFLHPLHVLSVSV